MSPWPYKNSSLGMIDLGRASPHYQEKANSSAFSGSSIESENDRFESEKSYHPWIKAKNRENFFARPTWPARDNLLNFQVKTAT